MEANTNHAQGVDPQPDLRMYIAPLWQRKWLILAIVALTTVATYVYFDSKPRVYEANATLFVGASTVDQFLYGFSSDRTDRNVDNQVRIINSQPTMDEAARILGVGEIDGSVEAVGATGTDFIEITATSDSPDGAADLANAVGRAYINVKSSDNREAAEKARRLAEEQLQALPDGPSYDEQRGELRADVQRYRSIESLPAGDASVIDEATPNATPIEPKPRDNAVFAFALSLLAALGLAFALERFDRRFKRVEDIAVGYGTSLLAAVPHQDDPVPRKDGVNSFEGQLKETFRGLRTNLQLTALDFPIQTLMITSAVPSEGKSTTVRNLAMAYREWGLRVAVIDCDLRRANLEKLFGLSPQFGLTDVLTDGATLEDALVDIPVDVQGLQTLARISGSHSNGHGDAVGELKLLASGPVPANPQAVLATQKVLDVLRALRQRFDVILIDTAPLLAVSDAIPLVAETDGVVVVSRINVTTRDAARRLVEILGRSRARLLGVVANDLPVMEVGGGYTYYGYRYGYGYGGSGLFSRRGKARARLEDTDTPTSSAN